MISRLLQFGRSIFVKQVLLYVLIILLISGVMGFLFFKTARQHDEEEIGRKLQSVARVSAGDTPVERLELIRLGDDEDRMVLSMKGKLEDIRQATGVDNIHVFKPDRSSLLDLDERFRIGSTLPLPQFDALTDILASGESAHTKSYRGARQQILMSAYAPIMDVDGQLFAVVGVDAGAGELAIIEQMGSRLSWITVIAIGVACLLALFFAPQHHLAGARDSPHGRTTGQRGLPGSGGDPFQGRTGSPGRIDKPDGRGCAREGRHAQRNGGDRRPRNPQPAQFDEAPAVPVG